MPMRRFQDRSILITGASAGIGRAAALAFAAEGGKVAIADLDEAGGKSVVEEIRAAGGTALFLRTDATDEKSVAAAIESACASHGPIRHAFNNVGAPRGRTLEGTSLEEWDWTLRISLTSTFLAIKHEIPVMRDNGGGTIVNTASSTGSTYTEDAPPAYSVAKAGVIFLTHYASCSLGKDGIRVNSVSPGLTATKLVTSNLSRELQDKITGEQVIKRLTEPSEIAAGVLYLSSDEAAMVTGIDLEVGGGRIY